MCQTIAGIKLAICKGDQQAIQEEYLAQENSQNIINSHHGIFTFVWAVQ
jgi:hypothetical protein